ncbi:MAG: MerR family transcriptional regulator [Candidatus Latescibacteria bacterium]|nr:MerR family transcriptional regulator [Candidatus Latescibacterota bacterium]
MKYPLGQKLYFSISEVAEITELQPYILRTWEKEFSCLRPRRLRGKNRAYRQRDINLILLIKKLLYEERFTVQGVRQKLKNDAELVRQAIETDVSGPDSAVGPDEAGGEEAAAAEPSLDPPAAPGLLTDLAPVPGPAPSPLPPVAAGSDQQVIDEVRAELRLILRLLA